MPFLNVDYQIQAKIPYSNQVFQQVADKLEPQQQELIMNIGEALKAEAREEGKQQGRQEGRQESMYAIASNMLRAGTAPDFIQRMTGLPLEAIRNVTV